jgi:hypothetical protein
MIQPINGSLGGAGGGVSTGSTVVGIGLLAGGITGADTGVDPWAPANEGVVRVVTEVTPPDCAATAADAARVYCACCPKPFAAVMGR